LLLNQLFCTTSLRTVGSKPKENVVPLLKDFRTLYKVVLTSEYVWVKNV